jgi:protein-tyrosine phosphatase
MAEAVMRDRVAKAGLSDKISVDSAGIGNWHAGEPAHRGTLSILRQYNIPHNGRARQIVASDLSTFDYVLPVDRMTYDDLRQFEAGTSAEVSLFLKWAAEAGQVDMDEVPDPYYDGRFEQTYALVTAGCQALLDHIRAEHNL